MLRKWLEGMDKVFPIEDVREFGFNGNHAITLINEGAGIHSICIMLWTLDETKSKVINHQFILDKHEEDTQEIYTVLHDIKRQIEIANVEALDKAAHDLVMSKARAE